MNLDQLKNDFFDSPNDLILGACNLCACGGEEVPELLIEILRESAMAFEFRKDFYRSVAHEMGAKILDSHDWIDHGTGIGWAWVTEEGKILLDMIDNFKQGMQS